MLKGTARAADLLVPWTGFSLWLVADGQPRARTAIVRGWAGMVVAAVIENGLLKPAIGRRRPDANRLPPAERRRSRPSTSAFPSGHTGASTAFCVAVAREQPRLQSALAATVLAVAYAEFYTGRHHLSDALIGAAIGAAVGSLVCRLPLSRLTVTPTASAPAATSSPGLDAPSA